MTATRTCAAIVLVAAALTGSMATAAEIEWVRLPSKTTAASLTAEGKSPLAAAGVRLSDLKRAEVTYWQDVDVTIRCTDVFVDDLQLEAYCERPKGADQ